MSGMFAVLVSGRLVQTDFQQVDTNKFLINIPNVDEVNHIAVFMTGTQPLPADMGASGQLIELNELTSPINGLN